MERVKEKEINWGDVGNFDVIYRIKGRKGMYNNRSDAYASGMVPMVRFGDPYEICSVHRSKLVQLSSYTFITYAGHKNLVMINVFQNLNEYFKITDDVPEIKKLMGVMVPEYDEDKFLEPHARMVFEWYREWIVVVNKIIEKEDDK